MVPENPVFTTLLTLPTGVGFKSRFFDGIALAQPLLAHRGTPSTNSTMCIPLLIFIGPLDMIHHGLRNESPSRLQLDSQLLLDGLQHSQPFRSSVLRRRMNRPSGFQRKVPQPC